MEALMLLFDAIMLATAIHLAFRDERKAGGAKQTSFFRTASVVEKGDLLPVEQGWRGRPSEGKRQ